jgi:thiol-disulfide isomerase/thioredoxin
MARGRVVRGLVLFFTVPAVLYAGLSAGLYAVMRQPPRVMAPLMNRVPDLFWMALPMERLWKIANRGALQVGDVAPDFDLPTLGGDARVKLSTLRGGKPIVLVFGSYTCPPFRKRMEAMLELYQRYHERADFYFVYIQEAHATDGWPDDANVEQKIVYAAARTPEERAEVASVCVAKLKIPFPMLVDGMDDATDRAYSAWPIRLYIVDPQGHIAFKSETGPFGFRASLLEPALEKMVGHAPPLPKDSPTPAALGAS